VARHSSDVCAGRVNIQKTKRSTGIGNTPRDAGGTRSREDMLALALRVVERHKFRTPHIAELCAAAGVSERTLRSLFTKALGMPPHRYLRVRRLHLIRGTLAVADPQTQTVSGVARRFGYSDPGRMASQYYALFGEYPSATLQRRASKRARSSRRDVDRVV